MELATSAIGKVMAICETEAMCNQIAKLPKYNMKPETAKKIWPNECPPLLNDSIEKPDALKRVSPTALSTAYKKIKT